MSPPTREWDGAPAQDAAPVNLPHDAAAQASTEHPQRNALDAPSVASRRQRSLARGEREALDSTLTGAALRGSWEPSAEMGDAFRRSLQVEGVDRNGRRRDLTEIWRLCKPAVLERLDALGLTAVVECTDGPTDIADHLVDQAGLVRVARRRERTLVRAEFGEPTLETYRQRMAAQYGLLPTDQLPRTLREFCGQSGPEEGHELRPVTVTAPAAPGTLNRCVGQWRIESSGRTVAECGPCGIRHDCCPGRSVERVSYTSWEPHRPAWMDHVHAWFDQAGEPVLTADPYDDAVDFTEVVRDVASMPLTIERHDGVWFPRRTMLLVMRWDPHAAVLPAEHRNRVPEWRHRDGRAVVEWVAR